MIGGSGIAEAAEWDGVETLERIRAGDVSATEVLESAIARAEAAEPLGAIVTACFDRARSKPPTPGPFSGLPTFIKDLAQLAGVRTTWGSAGAGHFVSKRSDAIARRFESLGFVPIGKSATPEFGMTATTEPLGAAPCRNPWDPTRSTGGSSGGSAALVAAGVVPIAHASDGGGSIRIPASCCGVLGLKASRGTLDMQGSPLLPVNLAVDGAVARSVRDLVAFWDAIDPGPLPSAAGLRIAFFTHSGLDAPVHPATQRATRDAAALCEELGHRVEEIPCPFPRRINDDFFRLWGMLAWIQERGAKALTHPGFDASELEPWTKHMADYFRAQRAEVARAVLRLRAFPREYQRHFDAFDVLINPVVATPAPPLGHLAVDLPFPIAFHRIEEFGAFTGIQNVAGAPAISLPLGEHEGLPIGVQLSTTRGRDKLLLALAADLERARPWPRIAPPERWIAFA